MARLFWKNAVSHPGQEELKEQEVYIVRLYNSEWIYNFNESSGAKQQCLKTDKNNLEIQKKMVEKKLIDSFMLYV